MPAGQTAEDRNVSGLQQFVAFDSIDGTRRSINQKNNTATLITLN